MDKGFTLATVLYFSNADNAWSNTFKDDAVEEGVQESSVATTSSKNVPKSDAGAM